MSVDFEAGSALSVWLKAGLLFLSQFKLIFTL